jgi:hypothetical protein
MMATLDLSLRHLTCCCEDVFLLTFISYYCIFSLVIEKKNMKIEREGREVREGLRRVE